MPRPSREHISSVGKWVQLRDGVVSADSEEREHAEQELTEALSGLGHAGYSDLRGHRDLRELIFNAAKAIGQLGLILPPKPKK